MFFDMSKMRAWYELASLTLYQPNFFNSMACMDDAQKKLPPRSLPFDLSLAHLLGKGGWVRVAKDPSWGHFETSL